jgi:hypothetical protein
LVASTTSADEWGPGFFLCLLLGAVIAWRVATIRM